MPHCTVAEEIEKKMMTVTYGNEIVMTPNLTRVKRTKVG